MRSDHAAARLLLVLLALAGCGEAPPPSTRDTAGDSSSPPLVDSGQVCGTVATEPSSSTADGVLYLENNGEACIYGTGEAGALVADEELFVEVVMFGGCDSELAAECCASVAGGSVRIEASLEMMLVEGATSTSCTGALFGPSCALEPLPEGSYELWFGGEAHPFDVPGERFCMAVWP